MTKTELRHKYQQLRAQKTPENLDIWSLEIANKVLELPIWDFTFYHLFLSISEKKEINTEFLLHILQGKDKNVVLSKSNFKTHHLHNILLTDSTKIQKNKWGIPEPEEGIEIPPQKIEVVFIPLLAFDEKGHRIGYGKGFYDRFLSTCSAEILKIGLSFFEAETELPEINENDIPMDYCVTPQKVYSFS